MRTTAQMNLDALKGEIERLGRELAHVNEQCRVAHAMAMDYRTKYRACEKQRASLERKLGRRHVKQKPPEPADMPAEGEDEAVSLS
jgi:hypothetical protein